MTDQTPSPQSVVVPVELMTLSLKAAEQFIVNGIETGYVRLPDYDDDPAHSTLPLIRDALALLSVAPAPSSLAGGISREQVLAIVRQFASPSWCSVDRLVDTLLAALSPEAPAREGEYGAVHYGDPCIRCGVGHDDVPPGPCRGDGITISRERAHAVLDYLKNGRGPAGWPTQLWVEVHHFIANIEAALTPRHEAPADLCKSCNGTGRELGSRFNRCLECWTEAPAEGAGEAVADIAARLRGGVSKSGGVSIDPQVLIDAADTLERLS